MDPAFNSLPARRRPCCARTSHSFNVHADLSRPFARVVRSRQFGELRGKEGFSFTGWDGNVVVGSWDIHLWKLVVAHGEQAWPDLLHAATAPCFELLRYNPGERQASTVVLFRRPPAPEGMSAAVLARIRGNLWKVVTCYRPTGIPRDEQKLFAPLAPDGRPVALGFRCEHHELEARDQHQGLPRLAPWPPVGRSPNPGCCGEVHTCKRPADQA